MGLFLKSGYVDMRYCLNFKCPFTIVLGGRATGKTFGAQLTCIEDSKIYMLMRRTQAQADLISKPDFSPVNPVLEYLNRVPVIESATKYNGLIFSAPDAEAETRTFHGYTGALSTFSNLRGFDGSAIDVLLYDEFIPERHERLIKNEADCFFNVYETINRNRELQGREPLTALLLSNSNSLASPILQALGLVKVLERMQEKGQVEYINRDRGIAIFLLNNSPISAEKANTALYKATANTDFAKMSLANEFAYDDMTDVKSISLQSGWKLFARFGDIFIYGKNNLWYMSRHGAGQAAREYENTDIGIKKFVHDYPNSYSRIINHLIIYEDYGIKSLFTSIFI